MPDPGSLLWRSLFAALTAGRGSPLSVLIYHRVRATRDPMRPGDPTGEEFAWQMALLKRHFRLLPLSEAVERLATDTLASRCACVTFDDGYADNFTQALPILQRLEIPATVFVASGFLDGGRMWNDTIIESFRVLPSGVLDLQSMDLPAYTLDSDPSRCRGAHDLIRRVKYLAPSRRDEVVRRVAAPCTSLPEDLMLSTAQLRALHATGVEIGGHTVTHPILSQLSPRRAAEEIHRGKEELEYRTGAPVRLFAYPNGRAGADFHGHHKEYVKRAGYRAAVTTHPGASFTHTDPYLLPRFTPWDRTPARYLLRLALNARQTPVNGGTTL